MQARGCILRTVNLPLRASENRDYCPYAVLVCWMVGLHTHSAGLAHTALLRALPVVQHDGLLRDYLSHNPRGLPCVVCDRFHDIVLSLHHLVRRPRPA